MKKALNIMIPEPLMIKLKDVSKSEYKTMTAKVTEVLKNSLYDNTIHKSVAFTEVDLALEINEMLHNMGEISHDVGMRIVSHIERRYTLISRINTKP